MTRRTDNAYERLTGRCQSADTAADARSVASEARSWADIVENRADRNRFTRLAAKADRRARKLP